MKRVARSVVVAVSVQRITPATADSTISRPGPTARTIAPEAELEMVGIRPGEKLHEQMIGEEDSFHTYEYEEHFKILPAIHNWTSSEARIKNGKRVPPGFSYTSDNNTAWMTSAELRTWVAANADKIGSV